MTSGLTLAENPGGFLSGSSRGGEVPVCHIAEVKPGVTWVNIFRDLGERKVADDKVPLAVDVVAHTSFQSDAELVLRRDAR